MNNKENNLLNNELELDEFINNNNIREIISTIDLNYALEINSEINSNNTTDYNFKCKNCNNYIFYVVKNIFRYDNFKSSLSNVLFCVLMIIYVISDAYFLFYIYNLLKVHFLMNQTQFRQINFNKPLINFYINKF